MTIKNESLKIFVGGDISFSGIRAFSWGDRLLESICKHDLTVGNLEAPLTVSTKKRSFKSYYLKSCTSSVRWISPINALSLANNHILDYSVQGLQETMHLLSKAGIGFFGAGTRIADGYKPYIFEKDETKLAIFGASHFLRSNIIRPAGTANIFSQRLVRLIKKYKAMNFAVIVMPHWGYEYIPYPSPRERKAAMRIIKSGADLVVGSHPHEIQAHELIDGKHVFYSLGNWVFSMSDFLVPDAKLSQSMVLSIQISKDHHCSVKPLICIFDNDTAELADERTSQKALACLDDVSDKLVLDSFEYNKLFYDCITQVHEDQLKVRAAHGGAARKFEDQPNKFKAVLTQTIIKLSWLDSQTLKNIIYMKAPFLRKLIILSGSFC